MGLGLSRRTNWSKFANHESLARVKFPFPVLVCDIGGTNVRFAPASDFDHITISGYHGAMWAAATADQLTFKFYVVDGEVKKDECVLTKTKDGQKLKCTGASEQQPISDDEVQGEEP